MADFKTWSHSVRKANYGDFGYKAILNFKLQAANLFDSFLDSSLYKATNI